MKTRTGYFLGLAAALTIGVFAVMLAFGALTPQPAPVEANAVANPAPTLTLSGNVPGSNPNVTVVFTQDTTAIEEGTNIALDFAQIAVTNNTTVTAKENWKISVAVEAADDTPSITVPTITVDAVTVNETNDSVTLAFTSSHNSNSTQDNTNDIPASIEDDSGTQAVNERETVTVTIEYIRPVEATMDGITLPSLVGRPGLTVNVSPGNRTSSDTAVAVDTYKVTNSPTDPGAVAQYQVEFKTTTALVANQDTITLHFDKDITGTDPLTRNNVVISSTQYSDAHVKGTVQPATNPTLDPSRRVITTAKNLNDVQYTITVPDMDPGDPVGNITIPNNGYAVVTVTILSGAGLTNPTEAGTDGDVGVYTSKDPATNRDEPVTQKINVPLQLTLSAFTGNRGKAVTVTGKGFKNGTSAMVWLDNGEGGGTPMNGARDGGEIVLINSVAVGSDDTFSSAFTVTLPPFKPMGGLTNYINAKDGEGNAMGAGQGAGKTPPKFDVDGLMTISPKTLGVGDNLTITLEDWPTGGGNRTLTIGTTDVPIAAGEPTTYTVKIPANIGVGTQVVKISDDEESDTQNVTITGADVTVTPSSVVPGQTLTIVGRGFASKASLTSKPDIPGHTHTGTIQIGSQTIPTANIDGGNEVETDSSGNWSASVVIPVNATSVEPNAAHQIRVLDSKGRAGIATVAIPEPVVTVMPSSGRPGTFITVSGTGFPASGNISPTVNVLYDGTQRTTALTDSSGAFTVQFKVPTNVGIPSDNKVKATSTNAGSDNQNHTVEAEANHSVPAGSITLSASEIQPGQNLTITGEGFNAFATLQEIKIGTTQVTPSVTPSTDRDGGFTAIVLVPDLDVGLHTVSAKVNDVTSVASVTVVDTTTAPAAPGTDDTTTAPAAQEAMAPADAFAALIAADNLLQVYNFDPATQTWSYYSPDPNLAALNDLTMVEPGKFYFVQASEAQSGVTLGTRTVDIYAGWNPLTW